MSKLGKSLGPDRTSVRLGDVAKARMGKTILSKELKDVGLPVFSAGRGNEPWGHIDASDVLFGDDTIVISARGNIGFPRVPRITPFVSTQTTIAISLKDKRQVPFIRYQLEIVDWPGMTSQTTIPMITVRQVNEISLSLPSIATQQQIVAEIEKQFTRLDAGVAALQRVQANLKRYRAAVLKAACEGWLVPTEAELAKEGNRKVEFESGESLLARILGERRKGWKGRGIYKDPEAPDLAKLGSLPEAWTWARLGQLGMTFGGLTKNPKRAKLLNQLPYLRVANVYANELRLQEIEHIGVDDSELEKLLVRTGDLLIVEGNGSKDQIGRLAIWDGSIDPCVHQNHIIKVRLVEARMPKWVSYWLQSPKGRQFVELVASSTSGLYTLSVNKVGDLPIALPPLAEQVRIVAEVERRLSVIESLESVISANLQRATRLRQSILQKAFTGELV